MSYQTLSKILLTLVLPICVSSVSVHEAYASDLVQHLRDSKNFTTKDISSVLIRGRNSRKTFTAKAGTYAGLESHYRRSISALGRHYPSFLIENNFRKVFNSFSGKSSFSFIEAHLFPFLPISFLVHDDNSVKARKIETNYRGKTIHGLEIRADLGKKYQKSVAELSLDMMYLPTVNARTMGFNYAQLIPDLSYNVKPARTFFYNAVLPWSSHNRLRADDQISKPIPLTNYAHGVGGGIYTISVHPDFALELKNVLGQKTHMTFFLWKNRPGPNMAPDFIYKIHLTNNSNSLR